MLVNLDDFFETLKSTNLFYPLTDEEAEIAFEAFKFHSSQMTVHHFMFGMTGLVYLFDSAFWGIYSIEAGYKQLFDKVISMTRGLFVPLNVQFQAHTLPQEEGNFVAFSFEFNGRLFHNKLTLLGDIVDLRFVVYVNQSLLTCGVDGRFYWIETGDQVVAIIFLTKAQFQIIKQVYGDMIFEYETMLDAPKRET